ncbi:hypothetical protein SDC9_188368 [bioreactor metagenome]|uniref:Uncharacterized protein n=1 Tax=bioreactor metagenome TaxID=1076179 RepID=A0A645HP68_9ZZZZ
MNIGILYLKNRFNIVLRIFSEIIRVIGRKVVIFLALTFYQPL